MLLVLSRNTSVRTVVTTSWVAMAQHLLSDLVSYFTIDEINIDNIVFKLFYKVSTVLCMLGASIGVAQAYFGKPISCDFGDDLVNDYCWMHGGSYFDQRYQVALSLDKNNVIIMIFRIT